MGGVKTHIITPAVILDRNASDLAQLPKLLHTTAQNFTVRQVSADAVYNTKRNQEEIAAIGAEAFIPFKSNHTGSKVVCGARSFVSATRIGDISLNITTNDRMWRRLL
jgi:hypothetical protein